jgi:hypothetical protein
MTQYFWSSIILIVLWAMKLHILRCEVTEKITLLTHILHIFNLHFCTLILFSVITLNFTNNVFTWTKLQSAIVIFLLISYNDAITHGPSLSFAPPVSGGNNSRCTVSNESHYRDIMLSGGPLLAVKHLTLCRFFGDFVYVFGGLCVCFFGDFVYVFWGLCVCFLGTLHV